MLQSVTLVSSAVLLGIQHTLEADHVAVLSTIVADDPRPRSAARSGVVWGVGHLVPLFAATILIGAIPWPSGLSAMADGLVGVVLVVLGVRSIVHARGRRPSVVRTPWRRAAGVGVLHGIAGTGPLVALTAGALTSGWARLAFIVAFGGASILAMGALCFGLSRALPWARPRVTRWAMSAAGLVSILVGIAWVMR